MASTLPKISVFEAISRHDPDSTVVVHSASQRTFKYGELLGDVYRARDQLYSASGKSDLNGERIAFLIENSYDYVVTWLAILGARAIAVPLSPGFPAPELQYILDHSEALLLLSTAKFAAKAKETLATNLASSPIHVRLDKHLGGSPHDSITLEGTDPGEAGMMLYTSGTTNRPKGVLIPESVMTAQAQSLLKAWEYSPKDHLLHVLPLHHIHGTINGILTPLFGGSAIEFLYPFNADAVWKRLAAPFLPEINGHAVTNGNGTNGHVNGNGHNNANGYVNGTNGDTNGVNGHTNGANGHTNGVDSHSNGTNGEVNVISNHTNGVIKPSPQPKDKITFFTVVPTVYSRLLATHKALIPTLQEAAREAISPANLRVCISGSAALPTPIKVAWKVLSRGNVLLERFGMTEVGMALSCGLDFPDRVDGSVGWPLPTVEARLVELDTGRVIKPGEEHDDATGKERVGEIQLRGPTVFKEYWRNPAATASEFVIDEVEGGKWFKTGDVAVRRPVDTAGLSKAPSQDWTGGDMYFILGRKSADIIKSGGEKVSALEVERELLSLPEVAEAAVLAVPSGKWGQKVGAVIILDKEFVPDGKWTPMDMRRALKSRLVNYKIPQILRVVDHIPRNAMGKINKKNLVKDIFQDDFSGDEMPVI